MTTSKATENLPYCGQLVREQDPDRFLLSLLIPAQYREPLWALYAFNHEIAKTREVVTETQLGLIRLQWWRDAIAAIFEGRKVPENEVIAGLGAAVQSYDLPHELFEKLIYAREFDLEDVIPETLDGMVNYADFTHTPLMRLALKICGGDDGVRDEVVRDSAVNYALVGLIRAIPVHAAQSRCYLPADLLKKYDLRTAEIYTGKNIEALQDVVREIMSFAARTHGPEKQNSRLINKTNRIVYLNRRKIRQCGYNPFHSRMLIDPAFYHLRLLTGI